MRSGNIFPAIEDLVLYALPFQAQVQARQESIRSAQAKQVKDLVFEPFVKVPLTCYNGDISVDPNDQINVCLARTFGVQSIRVEKASTRPRSVKW